MKLLKIIPRLLHCLRPLDNWIAFVIFVGVFIMTEIIINSPTFGIKKVLVDDADYEWLNQWKWNIHKPANCNTYYAVRHLTGVFPRKSVKMHRLILGLTDPKIKGDHIDHNGLNNQRNNLRKCTHSNNIRNRRSAKNSASKYLGVFIKNCNLKSKTYTYWVATITIDTNKNTQQKAFPYTKEGEIQAAKYYDELAKKYYGEFANLNFKDEN